MTNQEIKNKIHNIFFPNEIYYQNSTTNYLIYKFIRVPFSIILLTMLILYIFSWFISFFLILESYNFGNIILWKFIICCILYIFPFMILVLSYIYKTIKQSLKYKTNDKSRN